MCVFMGVGVYVCVSVSVLQRASTGLCLTGLFYSKLQGLT